MKSFKSVFVNSDDGLRGIVNARCDLYNECNSWRLVWDRDELREIERQQAVIYAVQNKNGEMREVTRRTALKYL